MKNERDETSHRSDTGDQVEPVVSLPNYAGAEDIDDKIAAELEAAEIMVHKDDRLLKKNGEVKTAVFGELGPWWFERAWRYWVAEGPGIPPEYANELHETHGTQVRVDGHCGCPSPLEQHNGFAVSLYHVDTQDGLNALADTIRKVMADAKAG